MGSAIIRVGSCTGPDLLLTSSSTTVIRCGVTPGLGELAKPFLNPFRDIITQVRF